MNPSTLSILPTRDRYVLVSPHCDANTKNGMLALINSLPDDAVLVLAKEELGECAKHTSIKLVFRSAHWPAGTPDQIKVNKQVTITFV